MSALHSGDNALLREVRDCLAVSFARGFSQELDSAVMALEDQRRALADRARLPAIRGAIECLRLLQAGLPAGLERSVRARIDEKASPGSGNFSQTAQFTAGSLSLVSEDEVQEEIAIGNAARRLREAAGSNFYALNERMAAALAPDWPDEEQSPVQARVFVRAVLEVLPREGHEPAARLAALAALGPAMAAALKQAYNAANAILVQRGILPDMRRSYGAPKQLSGARAVAQSLPAAPEAAAHPMPGLFDRLINPARTAADPETAAQMVAVQVRPELVEALRKLDARLESSAESATAVPGSAAAATPAPVGPNTDILLRARAEVAPQLGPEDGLVADLVKAMFDRLLGDPHISDAAKVQLGRLQLPVFTSVMSDRRFFTDPKHPVRGLIDAVAELGAASDDLAVDGKRPAEWLETETQALIDAGRFEAQAFESTGTRLRELAHRHHELEAGKNDAPGTAERESNALNAVREASRELSQRIAAAALSPAAAAFATRVWRPVLVQDQRAGRKGQQWEADLKTLDDLLRMLAPRKGRQDSKRRAALAPSVRLRVWQGLIRTQLPTAGIELLMDELDRLHAALEPPAAARSGAQGEFVDLARSESDAIAATLRVQSPELDEEGLAPGSWLEFIDDDGALCRAQLDWMSPTKGACAFRDIANNRSFAISLADLRVLREAGNAKVMANHSVAGATIEGALEDVARNRESAEG